MSQSKSRPLLLVGAGQMSQAYAKVLTALDCPFHVLGRGEASAAKFFEAAGIKATTGSLDDQLTALKNVPLTAIVAVNAMYLADVAKTLMSHGVKRLLLEKPGALDVDEMASLESFATKQNAEVYVGYNRRFMSSSLAARDIIDADGGVLSVKFDFSEPSRRIEKLQKPTREFNTWFYGNSSHVVDLAFFFFGTPTCLHATVSGGLDWHPTGSIFTGHGSKENGSQITWHANWDVPGRWGLEVMTREHRLIMQPLEKLKVQTHDSFAEKDIEIDDEEDLTFKPGVKKQVERFLFGTGPDHLIDIKTQNKNMQNYEIIRVGGAYEHFS